MAKRISPPTLVLVVDDEYAIRQLARRILEMGGYRVIEAASGAEAIMLLDQDTPLDLLMANLNMPDLTGEEMVRLIRASRPDLKVLYVTGYIDRLLDDRPQLWEGEAYLDKPFTSDGLLEAVSLLLFGTLNKEQGPAAHRRVASMSA